MNRQTLTSHYIQLGFQAAMINKAMDMVTNINDQD